ncbi:hypothetical protein [Actinomadura parmotrematis]|uniref:Uncharacterized protein n=1 Tax=Actinomadura parmotrematis TaxID=2864039 RepID=A0ABS7FU08_9ACTN|nr:hypothetical protein [Actinomadura parmotrematis]MBW8483072.1 hypothetical protein [Actinomadura parmotrematis]
MENTAETRTPPAPDVVGRPCQMCGSPVKDAAQVGDDLLALSPCGCVV